VGARALEMDDPGPLQPRKTSTGMDVMVVDAAPIEPVLAVKFPSIREKNGEFRKFKR
jgi:hypothetical protein